MAKAIAAKAKNSNGLSDEDINKLFGAVAEEEETEELDEEDSDEEEDDEEEATVTITKSQLARLNSQGAKWRARATGKDDRWDGANGRAKTGAAANGRKPATKAAGKVVTDEDAPDAEAIRAEIEAEFEGKSRMAKIQTAAGTALLTSGLTLPKEKKARSRAFTKAFRLLDLDELEIEDDGEVDGLDEAIEELKQEFPALFGAAEEEDEEASGSTEKKVRRGHTGRDGANESVASKDPLDILAKNLFGKSR